MGTPARSISIDNNLQIPRTSATRSRHAWALLGSRALGLPPGGPGKPPSLPQDGLLAGHVKPVPSQDLHLGHGEGRTDDRPTVAGSFGPSWHHREKGSEETQSGGRGGCQQLWAKPTSGAAGQAW